MVQNIVKDLEFLAKKCKPVCNKDDKTLINNIIQDLRDTAAAYEQTHDCVGLAANQLGYDKKIIIVNVAGKDGKPVWKVMQNPVITVKSKTSFESEEGCLSLEGTQTVKRWYGVSVVYRNINGKMVTDNFYGQEAAIVQHEIDHLNGRLI